jgi:uncharacterized membrane protein
MTTATEIGQDIISFLDWIYSIGLGLLGHIFMNLGQGLQKTGVQKRAQAIARNPDTRTFKYAIIWVAGFVVSGIGVVMFFYALDEGHTPTLAALSGFGIAALTVYSQIVLKERIGILEYLALAFIVVGTIVVNLAVVQDVPKAQPPDPYAYWLTIVGLVLLACVLFSIAYIKKPLSRGALYGVAAGILGGCEMLSQKATTIEVNKTLSALQIDKTFSLFDIDSILIFMKLPEFYLSWIFMLFAFITMQIGYRFGRAVTIVPSFSALYIITPFVGSIVLFNEKLVNIQWIGIVFILIGVINLSRLEHTHLNAVDKYMEGKDE